MPNRTLFPLALRRRSLAGYVEGSDDGASAPPDKVAELEHRLARIESRLEGPPAERPRPVRVAEEEPQESPLRSLLRRMAD